MITLTYQQMLDMRISLQNFVRLPFRGASSLQLARIAVAIENELRTFDEQHAQLISKFGGVKNEMGVLSVPEERIEEFSVEYMEMIKQEISIPLTPLKATILDELVDKDFVLKDDDGSDVFVRMLTLLAPIFEEEE